MFFSQQITDIQAVLVVLEDTFECNSEHLFVDLPLAEMIDVSPSDMDNFIADLGKRLGFTLETKGITEHTSINALARSIQRSRTLQNLSAA
ncbi:hypothetical protein [Alteromonas sp. 14N.309.X.WAT.G.H12]|uniref:hypothetical protein n=1 Tax=Alteromonas sp. 14N.309.X.WAT.G.H12 TaxID=3120824 RepID=UPI002FD714BF